MRVSIQSVCRTRWTTGAFRPPRALLRHVLLGLLASGSYAQVVHDGALCIGPGNSYPPGYFNMDFFDAVQLVSYVTTCGPMPRLACWLS